MSTTSSERTSTAVEAFINFASDIFERHFVMDLNVRRRVIELMLERGKIFEQMEHNYDITSFLAGFSSGAIADPTAMKKSVVTVTAGLKPSQQSLLSRWNPDIDVKFLNATTESHSVAYAQRVIDTERCKSLLHLKEGPFLDIGGNWMMWLQKSGNGNTGVHCCNLIQGEMEHHRQTQRHVLAELHDKRIDPSLFCTHGAAACDFRASEGICIHVLPEIDPDSIPTIFEQHGLKFMTGVHHYDPDIEIAEQGVMPDMNMHWELGADGVIKFFFADEGSHPYMHKREWLLEYSRCWVRSKPSWPYVVYYAVDYIRNGILKWTMIRMEKETLGAQCERPQFRYLEHPGTVELMVPVFDAQSGYGNTAPQAYMKPRVVQVPQAMFAEVYRIGVSNETFRPDKPLSLDDIRNEVHNFNTVRYLSGTLLTIPVKLDTDLINDIALGMYLLIVRRAAQNAITVEYFKKQMRVVQDRWNGTGMLGLLKKATAEYMIWPLISPLVATFEEAVSAMSMYMRRSIQRSYAYASSSEFVPYRLLPPIRPISDGADRGLVFQHDGQDSSPDAAEFQEDLSPEEFVKIFGPNMTEKHREAAHKYAAKHLSMTSTGVPHAVSASAIKSIDPELMRDFNEQSTQDDYKVAHSELQQFFHDAEAEYYRCDWNALRDKAAYSTIDDVTKREFLRPREGSAVQVNAFTRERIYEFGLYCVDVGLGHVRELQRQVSATWSGNKYISAAVTSENALTDRGFKYIEVRDGVVQFVGDEKYAACVDPVTQEWQYIDQSRSTLRRPVSADFVAVNDDMKIFNSLIIGKNATQYAKRGKIPTFEIELVDGVFGCGKTFRILSEYETSDLIVCTVKDTAVSTRIDLEKKLMRDIPGWSPEIIKSFVEQRVRSADSAAMHHVPTTVNVLWCDEGLMAFPGQLLYIAAKCNARMIRVIGDSMQIGAIQRGTLTGSIYFSAFFFYTNVLEDNLSKRSPGDVMYAASRYYPEHRRHKLRTLNPVRRSMFVNYETDIKSQYFCRANPSSVYLSVLQADKSKLLQNEGFMDGKIFSQQDRDVLHDNVRPVYSTHESQGRTFPEVTIVRMNTQTVGVFSQAPHLIVNMSRHTIKMRYVSLATANADPLSTCIEMLKHVPDEDIDKFMEPTPDWLRKKIDKEQTFVEKHTIFPY